MTSLATLVASTTVGQYAQLTGFGNVAALQDTVPGGSGNECGYVSRMPYDPITRRCYLSSSDDPGDGRRMIAYDIATHAWVTVIAASGGGPAHGYGQQGMDVSMRRYWYGAGGTSSNGINYRNLATGATSTNVGPGGLSHQDAPSLCEFPDRRSIYYFQGTAVWRKREDAAWTQLAGSYQTSAHSCGHYNARHKCLVFGGGADFGAGSNLWRINLDETIQQYSGLPFSGLEMPRYRFVENDATGEFFVYFRNGTSMNFWTFNPSILTSGAWTNPGISGIPTQLFGLPDNYALNRLSLVAENIFTHGCILFATADGNGGAPTMWIYRYR
jgi:hypothetical protein